MNKKQAGVASKDQTKDSVLLYLGQSTAYCLLLENEMSDLVTLVAEYKAFFSLVPVYIIFPRRKKSIHAILNIVSIFSLSTLTGLILVIFSIISFVIGKCVTFCFKKSLFQPFCQLPAMQVVVIAYKII